MMNNDLFDQIDEGDYVIFVTEFLNHINDGIMVYFEKNGQYYTDGGDCSNEGSMMPDAIENDSYEFHELVKQAAKRFNCKVVDDKIRGRSLAQVLQAEIWFFTKLEGKI